MGDLIDRDKIYEAVYDLACKSVGVIGGISEDYAYGLLEAAHMIEEAPAVDAVPMTHDLDSSDLIRRKDVLWITKETGAWETQNRVRELPAVAAVPLEYHETCMEAAIKIMRRWCMGGGGKTTRTLGLAPRVEMFGRFWTVAQMKTMPTIAQCAARR